MTNNSDINAMLSVFEDESKKALLLAKGDDGEQDIFFSSRRTIKVNPNKLTKKLQPWFDASCHEARRSMLDMRARFGKDSTQFL